MRRKIPCPKCGETNYDPSPLCWACGAPLREHAAPPEERNHPATLEPTPDPTAPSSRPANGPASESAEPVPGEPKPAERDAQALRDKDYVTPPVDLRESPHGLADWMQWLAEMPRLALGAFREALDEYDARRGRKSGTMSSYGCFLSAVLLVVALAVLAWLMSVIAPALTEP